MDKEQSAAGGWTWNAFVRKHRVRLALASIYVAAMIPVMALLDEGFVLAVGTPLFIVLFSYVVRYLYVRICKPFTERHRPTPRLAMFEEDLKESVEPTEGWTRAKIVATGLFTAYLVVIFFPAAFLEILTTIMLPPDVFVEMTVDDEPREYMVLSYNAFGSLGILLVVLCVVDFADLVRGAVIFFCDTENPIRAPFLSYVDFSDSLRARRLKASVVLVLWMFTTIFALSQSYMAPKVIEKDIFLASWPACLDGYKVALVTDVHSGLLVGRAENERLADQINALGADVVVLAGDLGDGLPQDAGPAAAPLAGLTAPDGVYFVTGNHEYLHGSSGQVWPDFWRRNGVTVLNNTRVALPRNPAPLCDGYDLVGVEDFGLGEPDLSRALAGRNQSKPAVLAAHQPQQALEAAELGISLQLSGHVHGGQIWPLHSLTYLNQAHFAGLEAEGDSMLVYTSQGAFGWGPRTRVFSENNIDLLFLHPSSSVSIEKNNDLGLSYTIVWAWLGFPFLTLAIGLGVLCSCPSIIRIPRRRDHSPSTRSSSSRSTTSSLSSSKWGSKSGSVTV